MRRSQRNILNEYIISKADVHYHSVGNPPALPAGRLSVSVVDPLQSSRCSSRISIGFSRSECNAHAADAVLIRLVLISSNHSSVSFRPSPAIADRFRPD